MTTKRNPFVIMMEQFTFVPEIARKHGGLAAIIACCLLRGGEHERKIWVDTDKISEMTGLNPGEVLDGIEVLIAANELETRTYDDGSREFRLA